MPVLLILMTIKFVMVVSLFMHLRFDSRVFRWFFVSGIVLAVVVYTIVLTTHYLEEAEELCQDALNRQTARLEQQQQTRQHADSSPGNGLPRRQPFRDRRAHRDIGRADEPQRKLRVVGLVFLRGIR